MSKSYLVGWFIAYKYLLTKKHPKKIWKQLVKKRWYWMTKEERVQNNKECMDKIREIEYPKLINYEDVQ